MARETNTILIQTKKNLSDIAVCISKFEQGKDYVSLSSREYIWSIKDSQPIRIQETQQQVSDIVIKPWLILGSAK